MLYDLVIIGGGPAGVAAGVYAARKKIKTVLVTDLFGGQSLVSAEIQNWIGDKSISGFDLGKKLEEHLRAQEDIEIMDGDRVRSVMKKSDGDKPPTFVVETENGKKFETKTVLVTTGSRYKRLGIPGEEKLEGRGVAFCSTCDAPIFKDKDVAVVGGGNSSLEAVHDLLPYAKNIILIHRGEVLKGDPVSQERYLKNENVKVVLNAETQEILGDDMVSGLRYLDKKSGEVKELKVHGVFVKIGLVPNTDFVGSLVGRDSFGQIVVDHKTQRASLEGIWAAGDSTDVLYKQNNISAGDAVKAVLNIYDYLKLTKN